MSFPSARGEVEIVPCHVTNEKRQVVDNPYTSVMVYYFDVHIYHYDNTMTRRVFFSSQYRHWLQLHRIARNTLHDLNL